MVGCEELRSGVFGAGGVAVGVVLFAPVREPVPLPERLPSKGSACAGRTAKMRVPINTTSVQIKETIAKCRWFGHNFEGGGIRLSS